jgi:putative FmdB family regulatory protein
MLRRYNYRCIKCDTVEEHWVDSSETGFVTCRECGDTAQRIISPVRTHFKGTGWPDADDAWAKDHERAAKK